MWFEEKLEICEQLRAYEESKLKFLDLSLDEEDETENIVEINLGQKVVEEWPHQK